MTLTLMPSPITAVIAGQPLGGRDLDQHVRAVDDLPQRHGLRRSSPRCRARAAGPPRSTPGRRRRRWPCTPGEQVAGVAHIVGGDRADGRLDVGAALGELAHLRVVGVALGQRGLEDRRVGGDPDDVLGRRSARQVARVEPLAGQVVQPYGHPHRAERCEVFVLRHRIRLSLVLRP